MPNAYLKKLAQKTDKSLSDIERYWKQAKKQVAQDNNKSVKELDDEDYAYITGIVQKRAGVKENKINSFLNFEGSVEEFLNETVTSANFVIGNVVPPEDEEEDLDVDSGEQDFIKDKQYENDNVDNKIVDYDLITEPEGQEEKCDNHTKEEKIVDYTALDRKAKPISEESVYNVNKKKFNLNEFQD